MVGLHNAMPVSRQENADIPFMGNILYVIQALAAERSGWPVGLSKGVLCTADSRSKRKRVKIKPGDW